MNFTPGDAVIVKDDWPETRGPAHIRTPHYLRGHRGRVVRYLGGVWTALAWAGRIVPAFVRDAVYDWVARHRHQLIRRGKACLLPTPEQRERFVDWSTLAQSS